MRPMDQSAQRLIKAERINPVGGEYLCLRPVEYRVQATHQLSLHLDRIDFVH